MLSNESERENLLHSVTNWVLPSDWQIPGELDNFARVVAAVLMLMLST